MLFQIEQDDEEEFVDNFKSKRTIEYSDYKQIGNNNKGNNQSLIINSSLYMWNLINDCFNCKKRNEFSDYNDREYDIGS
jgi:hypothetical protein